MAWTGYNTKDSLKAIIQPTSEWTTTSKPHTLTEIETINDQIYSEILMKIDHEGINTDALTENDLKVLSLINSYGSASLIKTVNYGAVPQKTPEKSQPATRWETRYEKALASFINSKKKKINASSSFGSYTGSNSIEKDPFFTSEDVW